MFSFIRVSVVVVSLHSNKTLMKLDHEETSLLEMLLIHELLSHVKAVDFP